MFAVLWELDLLFQYGSVLLLCCCQQGSREVLTHSIHEEDSREVPAENSIRSADLNNKSRRWIVKDFGRLDRISMALDNLQLSSPDNSECSQQCDCTVSSLDRSWSLKPKGLFSENQTSKFSLMERDTSACGTGGCSDVAGFGLLPWKTGFLSISSILDLTSTFFGFRSSAVKRPGFSSSFESIPNTQHAARQCTHALLNKNYQHNAVQVQCWTMCSLNSLSTVLRIGCQTLDQHSLMLRAHTSYGSLKRAKASVLDHVMQC